VNGIGFTQIENALWLEDVERTQRFSDRFASLDWAKVLNAYAKKVNPLMDTLLESNDY